VTLVEARGGSPVRLAVTRNGEEAFAATTSGPSGTVSFHFGKLVEGDRLAITAQATGRARELKAGEGTKLVVEASRL
jgi:hypothetical protein